MIFVYKTSVKTNNDIQKLTSYLNKLCKQDSWNFDLEDCDNILRIDSQVDLTSQIISGLKKTNFIAKNYPTNANEK